MVTIGSRRFRIEISISHNQNAYDTLILSITGSSGFNGYEVCYIVNTQLKQSATSTS